jgi:iron uptake system component EfeO
MPFLTPRPTLALLGAAGLVLTGCGGSIDTKTGASASAGGPITVTATDTECQVSAVTAPRAPSPSR